MTGNVSAQNRSGGTGFHPLVEMGDHFRVLDLDLGYHPAAISLDPPSIGRYNEKRRGMYTTDLFGGVRNIHVGLDFWVPPGTPVYAFDDGDVLFFRNNDHPGDYGPTVVTRHSGPEVQKLLKMLQHATGSGSDSGSGSKSDTDFYSSPDTDTTSDALYALHGHLSRDTLSGLVDGMPLKRGQVIATVGTEHENGGWVPHLHFQLALHPPKEPDMPGVVSEADLPEALKHYPDPQWVTGRYY